MQLLKFIKTVYQNYFELTCFISSSLIILLAILMDHYLGLDACPMCIMSRYAFGLIAFWSLLGFLVKKINILSKKFNLQEISMGMSSDYLKAIENSSTYLRIGSSIFGQRI